MSDARLRDGRGHRGHTPAWYRTVIAIDVFTLIVLGVALVLRRSEPRWPIVMLLIMLPFAAHVAATVFLAIRDARRRVHQEARTVGHTAARLVSVYYQAEWAQREREVTGQPAYDYITNAEGLQRASADGVGFAITTPDGLRLLSPPIELKQGDLIAAVFSAGRVAVFDADGRLRGEQTIGAMVGPQLVGPPLNQYLEEV
jgi:hypothetical protein